MSKMLRKLRIVFSAVCGIICLLLIALWARSYSSCVFVVGPLPSTLGSLLIETNRGRVTFCHAYGQRVMSGMNASLWGIHYKSIEEWEAVDPPLNTRPAFSFFRWRRNLSYLILPYWSITLFFAAMGTLAGFGWKLRFSLCTLLITTTLVAAFRCDSLRDKMSNMLRKLRIAFSVVCGIVCLLLIVMWWASLSTLYSWQGHVIGKRLHIQAAHGKAVLFSVTYNEELLSEIGLTSFSNVPLTNVRQSDDLSLPIAGSETATAYFTSGTRICIFPFWLILLVAVWLAAIPWIPWRWKFSLRTLLIATTVVAALLGAIVYAIR